MGLIMVQYTALEVVGVFRWHAAKTGWSNLPADMQTWSRKLADFPSISSITDLTEIGEAHVHVDLVGMSATIKRCLHMAPSIMQIYKVGAG
jgi:hypothetical protein